jgi:hypothetical protein
LWLSQFAVTTFTLGSQTPLAFLPFHSQLLYRFEPLTALAPTQAVSRNGPSPMSQDQVQKIFDHQSAMAQASQVPMIVNTVLFHNLQSFPFNSDQWTQMPFLENLGLAGGSL